MLPVVIESEATRPDSDLVTEPVDAMAAGAAGSIPPIRMTRKTDSREIEKGSLLNRPDLHHMISRSPPGEAAPGVSSGRSNQPARNLSRHAEAPLSPPIFLESII